MWDKWDKKYFYTGVTAFVVIIACILVGYVVMNFGTVEHILGVINTAFMPVYLGFIFAYLLHPLVKKAEKYIFDPLFRRLVKKDKTAEGISKAFSILTVMAIAIAGIVGLFMLVIPEVTNSITKLVNDMPSYYRNILTWFEARKTENPEAMNYAMDIVNQIYEHLRTWLTTDLLPSSTKIISALSDSIFTLFSVVFNVFIGLIISIYFLAGQENFCAQIKRMLFSIFKRTRAEHIIEFFRETNQVFGKFISGKILDSIIVGIVTFIGMQIFNLPYAVLISVLIGVTNIIPFFGPYIGTVPSAILVFLVSPVKGVIFLVMILVIMQVDGNIISPKILGESIGLGSFWILFSILVLGSLFGVIGMIVAVPVFAMIFRMVKRWSAKRLKNKDMPVDTKYYH